MSQAFDGFPSDDLVEIDLASRVLGMSTEQARQLCVLLGYRPVVRREEIYLCRSTLDLMYHRLNPTYLPPEENAA